jgi:Sec-independent protein translocase protein TatA
MNKVSLLLIAAVALVATGCEKKPEVAAEAPKPAVEAPKAAEEAKPAAEEAKPAAEEPAAEEAKPAAEEPAAAEEAPAAAEGGGDLPAACKEYADKMLKCLESDKYPAAAKDGAKQGLEAMKSGWNFGGMEGAAKDAAMNAANDACTQSVNAMKQSGEMMCPGVW